MKIAFVTPAYYPANIGASLYCQELATGLKSLGHEVIIFTNSEPKYKKEETVSGIAVKRFYPMVFGKYYISKGMFSSILKERFDIIHSHHYGYYPATAGFLAAKIKNTPHVFGPYYHPPVYGFTRRLASSTYHLTQGLPLLRFSDIVLPHTKYEERLLLKCGARNTKILPNIVDTKTFKPPSGGREKTVIFVSSLIKEKGGHVALDLAEILIKEDNEINFVFVSGYCEQDLLKRLKLIMSKNKRIKLLSNVPQNELVELYGDSSVFILPSKYEAFARVAAEAQACGTPVVSTCVGGIPDVVLDKKTGYLVNYGSWKEFEHYVRLLLSDTKLRNRLGSNARKHIVKKFDKKVIVGKLGKIYEDML